MTTVTRATLTKPAPSYDQLPIYDSVLHAVGRTPMVRLNKVVPKGCATILAKCEFMNPTGSIKDRMAVHIIEDAEKRGDLKPGGVIVENTSGNTGQGLAMAAAVKGYRCVFTMPDKMSIEKRNMLKAFGAEVVITPTDVPGDSPDHYVQTALRIARETPGAFYVNQYHTPVNSEAHYLTTGPEIYEQTGGNFDAVMLATGTGGTCAGVAKYMKERDPSKKVIGVDILGSVHYHLFKTGTLPTPYVYAVEGIGEDIKCDAFDMTCVDDMVQVGDRDSFVMARRLVREEGLFCGGSSGSIVHAAIKLGLEMGPEKTIVVTLCDSGTRYITKYLSDEWMRDHGYSDYGDELGFVEDILAHLYPDGRMPEVKTIDPGATVGEAIGLMREAGVSQLPVVPAGGDSLSRPQQIVHELDILRGLNTGSVTRESPVGEIAGPIAGLVFPKARLEELYHIFETDHTAIVVDADRLVGVVSKIDLVEYLAATRR